MTGTSLVFTILDYSYCLKRGDQVSIYGIHILCGNLIKYHLQPLRVNSSGGRVVKQGPRL